MALRSALLAALLLPAISLVARGEAPAEVVLRGAAENFSETRRAELVQAVRSELRQAGSHDERVRDRAALVRLGDEETVRALFENFAVSKSRADRAQLGEVLLLARTPAAIPRLVQYIFLDDRLEHVNQDAEGVACKSSISARIIVSLLSTCPEFSPRTRRSAERAAEASDGELRDRLRAWWPTNRDSFARGDYAEASPLFQ